MVRSHYRAPFMTHTILVIISAILLLPGIVGIFLLLPGLPYMFVIALIFGFIDKFQHLTTLEIIILTFIAVVSLVIDHLAGLFGARWGGATKTALILGIFGFIIGIIVFPPFGGMIGLFVGVLVGDILKLKEIKHALKSASGSLLGALAGIIINLILGFLFLGLFIWFAIK